MKYLIRKFYFKLKRLFQFIPIIWRGYDFDYRYAIDLFKYQLGRTADFLESDLPYGYGAKESASRIRTAIELLDKVYNEEYAMEYFDQLEDMYGKGILNVSFVESKDLPGYYDPKWDYMEREDAQEIRKLELELMEKSRLKQERAHKILWDFIAHNIRNWWD